LQHATVKVLQIVVKLQAKLNITIDTANITKMCQTQLLQVVKKLTLTVPDLYVHKQHFWCRLMS